MKEESVKKTKNPMHEARLALEDHPKCGAHCRTTGNPCRNPAMKNGRCRMHGGKSTGRPITHGFTTRKRKAESREIRLMIRSVYSLLEGL